MPQSDMRDETSAPPKPLSPIETKLVGWGAVVALVLLVVLVLANRTLG